MWKTKTIFQSFEQLAEKFALSPSGDKAGIVAMLFTLSTLPTACAKAASRKFQMWKTRPFSTCP